MDGALLILVVVSSPGRPRAGWVVLSKPLRGGERSAVTYNYWWQRVAIAAWMRLAPDSRV